MFDYRYNFTLPCQPCTAEEFEKLVTSAKVRSAIAKARECEAAIRQLGDDADEMRKQLEAEKAKAKRNLPCIMFQATFDADGSEKRWRNNKNARLNGLFIVDIDHVENPMELWERISLPKNSPKGGGAKPRSHNRFHPGRQRFLLLRSKGGRYHNSYKPF